MSAPLSSLKILDFSTLLPGPFASKTFADLGAGADVVSNGELMKAISAGVKPKKIVYSGVGKTYEELSAGIEAGILQFNVESLPELLSLSDIAASKNTSVDIAIRVNPDVDAETHHKISTGRREDKFGIDIDQFYINY